VKTVSEAELLNNLGAVLKAAQKDRIVLTRDGKPSVVLLGVEAYDEEQLKLAGSQEFWRQIEERRRDPAAVPLADFKARLKAKEAHKGGVERTRNGGQPARKRRAASSAASVGKGRKGKR
jgi:prevent-host-death family protein